MHIPCLNYVCDVDQASMGFNLFEPNRSVDRGIVSSFWWFFCSEAAAMLWTAILEGLWMVETLMVLSGPKVLKHFGICWKHIKKFENKSPHQMRRVFFRMFFFRMEGILSFKLKGRWPEQLDKHSQMEQIYWETDFKGPLSPKCNVSGQWLKYSLHSESFCRLGGWTICALAPTPPPGLKAADTGWSFFASFIK
jgi:hypothetical protein